FEFIGTVDNSTYLTVSDTLKWRAEVCGGEEAILNYSIKPVNDRAKLVAKILGTEVVGGEDVRDCAIINVILPLTASGVKIVGLQCATPENGWKSNWMKAVMLK
ncbi:hypothetical protein BJ878DRAFT_422319, partial [Calycina marina]